MFDADNMLENILIWWFWHLFLDIGKPSWQSRKIWLITTLIFAFMVLARKVVKIFKSKCWEIECRRTTRVAM